MPKTHKKTELDRNYECYRAMENELLEKYYGKTAIFHHGKFIDVYNDFNDALKIATKQYGEGNFSVKEISNKVKRLGSSKLRHYRSLRD